VRRTLSVKIERQAKVVEGEEAEGEGTKTLRKRKRRTAGSMTVRRSTFWVWGLGHCSKSAVLHPTPQKAAHEGEQGAVGSGGQGVGHNGYYVQACHIQDQSEPLAQ